jgi:hypothetical protein
MWVGTTSIDPLTAPAHIRDQATFASLTFSIQKNAVRGEAIGHSLTSHALPCPTHAIIRRIKHLCAVGPRLRALAPSVIINLLRQGGIAHSAATGAKLPPIHLRALRATGVTAFLSRDINGKEIQLLGCWKSDSMLRYLHLQCHSRMCGYAAQMLLGSTNPSAIL